MRIPKSLLWTTCGCCLAIWAGTRSWGDDEQPPQGLRGILPAYAPEDLSEEAFSSIEESIADSWKAWTRQTAELVRTFYETEGDSVEAQKEALRQLKSRVETVEKALSNPRFRVIHPELHTLYGRLAPRVDLAEAMLDSLTLDPVAANRERLTPAFDSLKKALASLSTDLKRYRNGQVWEEWMNSAELKNLTPDSPDAVALVDAAKAKLEARERYQPEMRDFVSREPFLAVEDALAEIQQVIATSEQQDPSALREQLVDLLTVLDEYQQQPSAELESRLRSQMDQIRTTAPDGGARLMESLGAGFMNYNLRLAISEGLMNRFYRETRYDTSRIRDRVMEAFVSGSQNSTVDVSLDVLPSSENARFAIQLDGTVRTNTSGYTSQATVRTLGNHTFVAKKPIIFDGHEFSSEPAQVTVRANNRTVGASTRLSGMPLLGRIANNVAMREATSRTPQANAIAAGKIRSQVGTDLDEEADKQFANAAKDLETKTYGPLRKYDLYPDVMSLSSTDTEVHIRTRLMAPQELGGSRPTPVVGMPREGLVAQVHESLLTNSMDRMGLNGRTMTDAEVRELLESRFSEILGREVKFSDPPPTDDEARANFLMFDEQDPVRFTISEGVVTLFIRAGLKREGGEEIPVQVISVPFTPVVQGDSILLKRGNVGVRPVTRPPSVAAQVTRAQIMRQKIQSSLPERTVDGVFEIEQNDKTVSLRVISLVASGGWLTVTLE